MDIWGQRCGSRVGWCQRQRMSCADTHVDTYVHGMHGCHREDHVATFKTWPRAQALQDPGGSRASRSTRPGIHRRDGDPGVLRPRPSWRKQAARVIRLQCEPGSEGGARSVLLETYHKLAPSPIVTGSPRSQGQRDWKLLNRQFCFMLLRQRVASTLLPWEVGRGCGFSLPSCWTVK